MWVCLLYTSQKRIDKLEEAGIRCELTGYNGGYIRLLGYTPEMRNSCLLYTSIKAVPGGWLFLYQDSSGITAILSISYLQI